MRSNSFLRNFTKTKKLNAVCLEYKCLSLYREGGDKLFLSFKVSERFAAVLLESRLEPEQSS